MKTLKLTMLVIGASLLSGCSVYNAVKAGQLQADYDLILRNSAIYNSDNGSQYSIPVPHNESRTKMLVCYNQSGIFSASDSGELREVANEWLSKNKPGKLAGDELNRSGVWDSRTCYEFDIVDIQPIGAYLDEETGEVVIVGESHG
ncbi:hypothetical protein [Vibrio sp. McD22-P3]|uniref:hypothetical protein n=1 Tax=Vibrio sp. McD22-P3 TaxID=2724880 RepID=UPI001F45BB54|nr:hypothetical protein [Vibrio sp. McD22-P3]MCF4173914.1 hypothetical protein [Vibrio sp. McD22-P3]